MNNVVSNTLAEIKALFLLAMPVFIAQIFITSMGFVDAVMAGHVSKMDLAAIAVGGSFSLPALLFTQAILFAITPIVAQAYGRKDTHTASKALFQGLWLGFFIGSAVAIVLVISLLLLPLMPIDENIIAITRSYLLWMACAMPVIGIYQALRSFVEGHGRTKAIMLSNGLGFLIHIPLNYILVEGLFGMPAMGAVGCGLSTVLAFIVMLLALVVYISFSDIPLDAKYAHIKRIVPRYQWQLLRLGFPIGLSMLAEVSVFSIIALLVAPLGADVVAGHQVALNISAQTFMLPFSLGIALTIRIGYFIGQNNLQAVKQTARAGYTLALFSAVITALFMVYGTQAIAKMYTGDITVQAVAASLLFFAAIYQIPDAIQVSSMGILRAFKITRLPMLFTLFAYWLIALPIGYVLAFGLASYEPWGARGLWLGLVIGLSIAACLLLSTVIYVFRHPEKHLSNCNL